MDAKRQEATEIVQRLRAAGFQAYLVGGCVRDLVMGREPKDYDVATDATPAEVVRLYPMSLTVGAQFGVVIVPGGAGNCEVATFRSDGRYSDGRHPLEVRYAETPQEDVRRRDFTINGLLYDPAEDRVLDYVGGQADIRARRIRTIGDPFERFSEDHLRMLRAVRFAARFGFALDPGTLRAVQDLAGRIHAVSAERIRDEILKMLTQGQARRGFELLDESGLLREVLPEVKAFQGVEQPPEFHPEGDVWIHTLMMLEGLRAPSATLALGVLLHDVGKPLTFAIKERIRFDGHVEIGVKMAESICNRLRLSSHETERVAELVRHHMRFKDFPQMRRSTQLRFLRLDGFDEHLELHRLDCLASHGDLSNYETARRLLAETPPEEIKPARLLSGRDLIDLGYAPGPAFKQILQSIEDAQLDGSIHSREEALQKVAERFPKPSPADPAGRWKLS
ncbi:MAG TPA: CCA tRNA nucleotidyltransferase [Terriglobia bacterium]|nr:CCA tRNA nucleotidyltransferase [Terriglobia bacterium]